MCFLTYLLDISSLAGVFAFGLNKEFGSIGVSGFCMIGVKGLDVLLDSVYDN